MKPYKITIIPATNSNEPNRYLGTPGKIHVVGYAQVLKGTGAGVQIRKNIKCIIADRLNWELTFVTTDYCRTELQEPTLQSFFRLWRGIRLGLIDILIIHSVSDLENAINVSNSFLEHCNNFGAKLYIVHNDVLISADACIKPKKEQTA